MVKTELDAELINLLGDKTQQDNAKDKKVLPFCLNKTKVFFIKYLKKKEETKPKKLAAPERKLIKKFNLIIFKIEQKLKWKKFNRSWNWLVRQ